MNFRRLVLRGLWHHRRTQVGALLTAALTAAVITAALAVGDSVSHGMAEVAGARLGRIRFAAQTPYRTWRADLAATLAKKLGTTVSAAIVLPGSLARPDGSARVAAARVIGVDPAFWALSPGGLPPLESWPEHGVAVSEQVAKRLSLSVGDSLVARVERVPSIPRDAPMNPEADPTAVLLLEVAAVCDARSFASFDLSIGPTPPANVFLPRLALQKATGELGMANTLLIEGGDPAGIAAAVAGSFGIEDTGLAVNHLDRDRGWLLSSTRVFLEPAAEEAALGIDGAWGVLTWLVNDLRVGDRHTPYSMVAALPRGRAPIPDDLGDDEIVINTWLAEDLAAAPGDTIALTYYVLGDSTRLTEKTTEFRIREVVPIEGHAADPDLMPGFPGLTNSQSCRDWDPGFALDLSRIRDRDEKYWDDHQGTPKAFVGLARGQELWGNRFGRLTSVRFPGGSTAEEIEGAICARLDPATFGLAFTDVRGAGAAARSEGMDFASLFLGFSAFLLAAALLLLGLVVALNLSMRRAQIATLLALGFTPRLIARLFALEHAAVALLGGLIGAGLGVALAAAAIGALDTVWSDVAGSLPMAVTVRATTLLAGATGGAAVSFLVSILVLRRIVSGTVREAFTSGEERAAGRLGNRRGGRRATWIGVAFAVAAVTLALSSGTGRDPATAGAFFGSGIMLLIAALLLLWPALGRPGGAGPGHRLSALGLAWRNLGRRRGRSLATIGILAFGVFMFLGVSVFKRDRLITSEDRRSGTGGFALVGESAVAVGPDLDTPEGRAAFALDEQAFEGVRVVGLKVRPGDDASCRNLARAQLPELVGVDPAALNGRFTFTKTAGPATHPWEVLAAPVDGTAVPAVIDQATLWTLHKGVGDEFALTDEDGRPFTARIAGVIDNAILHGYLVIDREAFRQRYPTEGGHRRFLIDAPPERVDEVAAQLRRQLEDHGLALERTEVRLNSLNAVENTYLAIFQALGGMGLLLGTAGLALVVARNTVERRAEFALLAAVGFARRKIVRLVGFEHTVLLLLGLAAGTVASAASLIPAFLAPGAEVATPGMLLVLLGLAAGGMGWTVLAVRWALSGTLLGNLRAE